MKHLRIAWIVSGLWAAFCLYQGTSMFKMAWNAESSILEWGEKIKLYLAGIGTYTVGAVPLYISWLLYKFHKSRERGRLLKEKHRIEVRLQKIDEQQASRDQRKAAASPETGEATA